MIEAGCAGAALYVDLMYCNNYYHGPMQDFIHAYGHDILGPFTMFLMTKFPMTLELKKDSIFSAGLAALIFSGYSIMEGAQALGVYIGTFDSYDFIAYAAGTGIGLGFDQMLCKKKKKLEELVQ